MDKVFVVKALGANEVDKIILIGNTKKQCIEKIQEVFPDYIGEKRYECYEDERCKQLCLLYYDDGNGGFDLSKVEEVPIGEFFTGWDLD